MDVRGTGLVAALLLGMLPVGAASAASNSCGHPVGRVERLICHSTELRRLDAELGRLYDAVESETRGIDGDTGQVIDPFGEEHRRWLAHTRDRCGTEACLATAYRARIAQVRRRWKDVL